MTDAEWLEDALKRHGLTIELPFPSSDIPFAWRALVDELFRNLAALGVTEITQAKQKLGRLRVYVPRETDAIIARIEKAEAESAHISYR